MMLPAVGFWILSIVFGRCVVEAFIPLQRVATVRSVSLRTPTKTIWALASSTRPSPEASKEGVARNSTNTLERFDSITSKSKELQDSKIPKSGDNEPEQPPFPFNTIISRALDTIEDAVIHLRRVPYDLGWIPETFSPDNRATVVVLGSGWGAHALLKVADTFKLRIIVISPSNHFVFTPMLASAAVGTVEYRSMTESVRAANPMIHEYIEGHAVDVDIEKKIVKVQLENLLQEIRPSDPPMIEIPYDKLVVAVGCKVNDGMVPGAAKYSLRLKSCDDARRLRNSIGECLEYASRPDVSSDMERLTESEIESRRTERRNRACFAIVGGGPTGVELAGELSDFFRDVTRPRIGCYAKLRDDIRLILIHGGNELVQQFDPALRQHALDSLVRAGIEVRLETTVKEVGDGYIKLAPKGAGDDQIETIPVGLTVWAAGTGPIPFIEKLLDKLPPEARGKSGKIVVDKWLRCKTPTPESFGSVFVLGDAASFEDKPNSYLPQTAQVAGQQGAFTARILDRGYDLTMTPPRIRKDETSMVSMWMKIRGLEDAQEFNFLNLGLLAYVGKGEALSQVQIGDVPIFSYAGSISFVLWRSVYLVKQVATRNRVLVTFDWLKSAVFGRDITRL